MTTGDTKAQTIRDLVGISSDLKWSSVERSRIADRLDAAGNLADAQAILRMIQVFQYGEKRLALIANTVNPTGSPVHLRSSFTSSCNG